MFFNFNTRIKKDGRSTQQQEIRNILSFAESVIESYEDKKKDWPEYRPINHPIFEVINILSRKIQSDYMLRLISVEDESDLDSLIDVFLPNSTVLTPDGKTFGNLVKRVNVKSIAKLNVDSVLPWPWKRQRLRNTITNIGKGRFGPWKEDKMNHRLHLMLPMGVFGVSSGNHSISIGILQGTGTITAETVEDISEVYNYVLCDGKHYIRRYDNTIICEVGNFELAAIFEIGRLMTQHSISYIETLS
jgi:hypothetical protein